VTIQRNQVHVNGIGGKGMAPAAALGHFAGYVVSGDDLAPNYRTALLSEAGIPIEIGRNSAGPLGTDILVSNDRINLREESAKNQVKLSRLEFVSSIFEARRMRQLCVSGSFGKSTAASILWSTLSALSPSCYIGADVPGTTCGASLSTGDLAVVEACEYRDAYLALRPRMAILLNVFENHEDHFGKGTEGFTLSFANYLRAHLDVLRHLVLVEGSPESLLDCVGPKVDIHTVGFGSACRWRVSAIQTNASGSSFLLSETSRGSDIGVFQVPFTGLHVIKAAAAAAVVGLICGVSVMNLRTGLWSSRLPAGRLSILYESSLVTGINDNARHPQQVSALLSALRERWPESSLCLVVHPWGRRNARDLLAWSAALQPADAILVMPVGDASVDSGGAERADAADILTRLVVAAGGRGWSASSVGEVANKFSELLVEGRHWVLTTVGYESSQNIFAELHRLVQLHTGNGE
jgi:UDP-N-acetylmuramate--alanine ligase